jgi:hypothetical protein
MPKIAKMGRLRNTFSALRQNESLTIRRSTMTPQEIGRLQTYLREMFNMPQIRVKPRQGADDSAEVLIGEEFIATLYRDEDEGEISYAFTMSILEMDLP